MTGDRVRLYDRLPLTADADWWIDHAGRSPDGRVLYLGSGTGRLALPVAAAAEETVAVDSDPRMLEAFRRRLRDDQSGVEGRVHLQRTAIPDLDLGERFGRVLLPSSLLNEIADSSDRLRALRVAAAHCAGDGAVLLHLLNPYWLAGDPAGEGTIDAGDGTEPVRVVVDPVDFEPWSQRRHARLVYRFADGEVLEDDLDAVALFPHELEHLADAAGLEIVEQWGALPGRDPLTANAPSWHLVCRPA